MEICWKGFCEIIGDIFFVNFIYFLSDDIV